MQSSNLLIPVNRNNGSMITDLKSQMIMVWFLDESPRGASLLLSSLWEDLRPEAGPEGAHGPAHRRETVRLRALWQGLRTPPLPTHPPPASLQQDDLHAAAEGTELFLLCKFNYHLLPSCWWKVRWSYWRLVLKCHKQLKAEWPSVGRIPPPTCLMRLRN